MGSPGACESLGETLVSLLSPEKQLVDLPSEVFDTLLRENKVSVATPLPDDPRRGEE
jgi:hypothetical protein